MKRRLLAPAGVECGDFTTVGAETMPTGVLDQLSASMSVENATAGLLVSVWAVTIAVTSIPLVRATISWQRKPLILATLGIMTAANVMTALASTDALALVSRMIGATAHGVFWAVVVAYAATLVPPEQVVRALSIVLAGPSLANLVSLPAGTALAHAIGWRATFTALAVACALCVLLIASVVPRDRGAAIATEQGRGIAPRYRSFGSPGEDSARWPASTRRSRSSFSSATSSPGSLPRTCQVCCWPVVSAAWWCAPAAC